MLFYNKKVKHELDRCVQWINMYLTGESNDNPSASEWFYNGLGIDDFKRIRSKIANGNDSALSEQDVITLVEFLKYGLLSVFFTGCILFYNLSPLEEKADKRAGKQFFFYSEMYDSALSKTYKHFSSKISIPLHNKDNFIKVMKYVSIVFRGAIMTYSKVFSGVWNDKRLITEVYPIFESARDKLISNDIEGLSTDEWRSVEIAFRSVKDYMEGLYNMASKYGVDKEGKALQYILNEIEWGIDDIDRVKSGII